MLLKELPRVAPSWYVDRPEGRVATLERHFSHTSQPDSYKLAGLQLSLVDLRFHCMESARGWCQGVNMHLPRIEVKKKPRKSSWGNAKRPEGTSQKPPRAFGQPQARRASALDLREKRPNSPALHSSTPIRIFKYLQLSLRRNIIGELIEGRKKRPTNNVVVVYQRLFVADFS